MPQQQGWKQKRTFTLCLLALSAGLSACSSSGIDNNLKDTRVCTVSFEKNCTSRLEEFERKNVRPPATTVEGFPENPSCPGHRFLGWNTERDGSGEAFSAQTPIRFSNILLIVFAQWEPAPSMEIRPRTLSFSPMVDGSYGERFATLSVVVSELKNEAEADSVALQLKDQPAWLSWHIEGRNFSESEGTQTFELLLSYEGSAFTEGPSTFQLGLAHIPESYLFDSETQSIRVVMGNGDTENHPIPLTQANILAFNNHANKPEGRSKHYRLVEDIVLEAPVPEASNWTPIGNANNFSPPFSFPEAFTGSFDGGGHTLSGLVIHAPGKNYQGLFGVIGEGAAIENFGLIDFRVIGGNEVGGLAGTSSGTVQNCYATGSASGSAAVGGLLGNNSNGGLVENSYAAASVEGSSSANSSAGGLVGNNYSSTVRNSYATGKVESRGNLAGGLVGNNSTDGTVENSYATGKVEGGGNLVGGLVGNNNHTVQNSYATGNVEGRDQVGGLVGMNSRGTVLGSYATGKVEGRGNLVGGLVGHNSYSCVANNCSNTVVENCVALNPSVMSAGTYVGRVVGRNFAQEGDLDRAIMLNNLAFDGMTGSTWNNPGPNNLDGAEISAAELRTGSHLPPAFKEGPWTYEPGRLPGLLGQTVEMPEHIP